MNRWMRVVAAAMGGGLVAAGFAPIDAWWAVLPGVGMWFLALRGATAREGFFLGMLHGGVAYGVTLHWLWLIFSAGMVVLVAILAFFPALFGLGYVRLRGWEGPPWRGVFLTAMLWTAVEFFRSELFILRFPWVTPGVAWGPNALSPWVGVYGVSCCVVVAAAACVERRTRGAGMVLAGVVLLLGVVRPGPVEPEAGRELRVALVQSEASDLDEYLRLTRDGVGEGIDLVIWPEYAVPYDVRARPSELAALTGLTRERGWSLLLGTQTSTGAGPRDWRNTALWIEEGRVAGESYKRRTVHFFNDGIPGGRQAPLETRLGRAATPICFDCDFTGIVRQLTRAGAEFVAVPSFDAREWSATQHRQHGEMFRLRAAENGRWLACAASSGVTQIVDPAGRVRASLPLMEDGVLTGRIGRTSRLTFYTQAGWLFPWLMLGGAVAWAVRALLPASGWLSRDGPRSGLCRKARSGP